MKAIVLVAGYATRLYPLTENCPKALLEVGGKPLVDYILDEINQIDDIDEIVMVSNHKFFSTFEKWVEEKQNPKKIVVIDDNTTSNEDRLGAVGDILYAIKENQIDEDIILFASDNLFEFKLKDFVEFYETKNAPCIAVKEIDDMEEVKRFGVVEVDSNDKIIGFEEKPENPKSNLISTAVYTIPKNNLNLLSKYIDEGNKADGIGNFFKYLSENVDTFVYAFDEDWYDIGTHQTLNEVNEIYNKKKNI